MTRKVPSVRATQGFSSRSVNRSRQMRGTMLNSWAAIYRNIEKPYENTPLIHLDGSNVLVRERFKLLVDWQIGYYKYLSGGTYYASNSYFEFG